MSSLLDTQVEILMLYLHLGPSGVLTRAHQQSMTSSSCMTVLSGLSELITRVESCAVEVTSFDGLHAD